MLIYYYDRKLQIHPMNQHRYVVLHWIARTCDLMTELFFKLLFSFLFDILFFMAEFFLQVCIFYVAATVLMCYVEFKFFSSSSRYHSQQARFCFCILIYMPLQDPFDALFRASEFSFKIINRLRQRRRVNEIS